MNESAQRAKRVCRCATNHFDAQIFSPPYLFNGARPTIDVTGTANGIANNGQDLKVNSNEALKIISIIRYGTTTHAVDTDQRRIQLCGPGSGACSNTNANTVTIPADAGKALPGATAHPKVFSLHGRPLQMAEARGCWQCSTGRAEISPAWL
jgi:hypothetical protein